MQLLELLRSGGLTLPTDFRENVEFYVSQLDADASEETFYDDRDLYLPLLTTTTAEAAEEAPYQRVVDESEEALIALEKLKAWSDTSPNGISNFAKRLKAQSHNALVQEVGLTRLSGLLGEVRDQKTQPAGLAPRALMPIVAAAMERFPQDKQVQRQGCSALRAIALSPSSGLSVCLEADGAKMLVAVMRQHLRDVDVCRTAATSLATMVNKSQGSPVEMSRLRSCGAQALLQDILVHHCNDVQLDKVARQTIPFLKG